jgi:hypothetical protein
MKAVKKAVRLADSRVEQSVALKVLLMVDRLAQNWVD